jgi:predicted transcriptional regulator
MKIKAITKKVILINVLSISTFIAILILILNIILKTDDFFDQTINSILKISIIVLIITGMLLLSISTILTIKEYKNRLKYKNNIQTGNSRLTLQDIFENDNRRNIIKSILQTPGIHHNELLRRCKIRKGQLQWHLDVLLRNNIIKKENYGQYSVYFPITLSIDDFELFEKGLAKSETTIEILEVIRENPGITSSKIAKKINLARNTVKYHVDKLIEEDLIEQKKHGRQIELFALY